MNNYNSLSDNLTNSKEKYLGMPISLALVGLYCILALPFLIWHEKHLPILVIFLLSVSALFLGAILFFLSIKLFSKILEHGFHPIYEGIAILGFLIALSLSGFLENSAGRIFLLFFGFITFIIRFAKVKIYYSLSILAMILLANGLVSFLILQRMEVFTAYHLFKSRFQFTEVDLSDWQWDENTRILTNRSVPIRLEIPEGLFFHNPQDLSLKDKTGTGQIAGIISQSEKDPNSYPFIRIFFFPVYINVNPDDIKSEVTKYNDFQIQQGDIEEVNEIQPNREFTFRERIPPNAFWTFYDILRPRYSKTGYYLLESPLGSKVLLHLTENLEKGAYHEPNVQKFLNSISLD